MGLTLDGENAPLLPPRHPKTLSGSSDEIIFDSPVDRQQSPVDASNADGVVVIPDRADTRGDNIRTDATRGDNTSVVSRGDTTSAVSIPRSSVGGTTPRGTQQTAGYGNAPSRLSTVSVKGGGKGKGKGKGRASIVGGLGSAGLGGTKVGAIRMGFGFLIGFLFRFFGGFMVFTFWLF